MLRASIEFSGADAGLRGIAEGARAGDAGIAHGRLLTSFVDAAVRGDPIEGSRAREALRAAAGSAAVVDAAAVIGNFERMVRIADGTGIPLDGLTATVADEIRADLGLDAFASRRTTPRALWSRVAGPMVRGLALRALRLAGRRPDWARRPIIPARRDASGRSAARREGAGGCWMRWATSASSWARSGCSSR